MPIPHKDQIAGLIIAGGQGSRMGGVDKCLLTVNGVSLLNLCQQRLAPQVSRWALNANGEPRRFGAELPAEIPVLADTQPDLGPLGGVITGLHWLQPQNQQWLLTVAADTPFFPEDLADRLGLALQGGGRLAIACQQSRLHPLFGLWHQSLLQPLQDCARRGELKMQQLVRDLDCATVEFDDPDAFFNINRPEDLQLAKGRE